jgi:GT2 family glycosyltransferase
MLSAAGGLINMDIPTAANLLKPSKRQGQYDEMKRNFLGFRSLFFYKKYVYKELHGFDDDFFAHQEEIDLCWRAIIRIYDKV